MSFTPRTSREVNLAANAIPKKDLKDGYYYRSRCRNANFALWSAADDCFYHIREKFGSYFLETTPYFEDDAGLDLFFPLEELGRNG